PKETIAKVNADTTGILALPDMRERELTLGYRFIGGPPERLAAVLRAENAKRTEGAKSASVMAPKRPCTQSDHRPLPLRQYRVRAELGAGAVGDPGARLHLLVLQEARRCLDLVPHRRAQSDRQGSLPRLGVFLRYRDRRFPRLHGLWRRAHRDKSNR